MHYKYKDTDEWKKKGFKALGSAVLVIFSNILTITTMDAGSWAFAFVQIATLIATIIGVIIAGHYFTRPDKDYVVIDDQGVLIARGPWRGRKEIPLAQISRLVEREEVLVVDQKLRSDRLINDVQKDKKLAFEQRNSKETLIETDNLSSEDLQRLKQEMRERLRNIAEVL